ncbi:hypothetical protein JYT61_00535 [bacterium AH-315-E10]|nr:hypothetical protein [bacterium AH-315-E10]
MSELLKHYRNVHQQAFMPIFVDDGRDHRKEVEACVEAGMTAIEYTLRCPDSKEIIPWIVKTFPELTLVIGSTIDNDKIRNHCKIRYPQQMSLDELADLGVHGFVSMLPFSEQTLQKWSPTHLTMPIAVTHYEAYMTVCAGAHFAKMNGPTHDDLKKARAAAAFDYAPILFTGGQTQDTIPDTFAAGAACVATGFDLTLKDMNDDPEVSAIADRMREYLSVSQDAQATCHPELAANKDADDATWLASLPHYHPFG